MQKNFKNTLGDIFLVALAPIALILILSDFIRLDIHRPLTRWIFNERLVLRDANSAAWKVLNRDSEIVKGVRVSIARLRLMAIIVQERVGRDGRNDSQETNEETQGRQSDGDTCEG